MSVVKIVSNPYLHEVSFECWENKWVPIDEDHHPKSDLLKTEYTTGFFPFKVHDIVNVIIKEFGAEDEALEIVFEGPDDEWIELKEICSSEKKPNNIVANRGERYLNNARDVLPLIRGAISSVKPVIYKAIEDDDEADRLMRKYLEASGDVVPVCIMGNLSSGKSSFINALIGLELLPSGDRPVTSRVYQVQRAKPEENATIAFEFDEELITVVFDGSNLSVIPEIKSPGLLGKIAEVGKDYEGDKLSETDLFRKVIELINEADKATSLRISDLVAVSVHFGDGASWMGEKQLVFFDTPGSNSHSNRNHYEVLKSAMHGMSNGLPLYVTQYGGLDTNDNAELYNDIIKIRALDKRFTMLVINKADDADISYEALEDKSNTWIKDTVLVQDLDAQGIYFISSVVGLGSKISTSFQTTHYRKLFQRLKSEYSGEDPEYTTRLYDFNILPDQLKEAMVEETKRCSDAMLANSGLYSVECGVMDFAEKYSAYDKCSQSRKLLKSVFDHAFESLDSEEEKFSDWHEKERLELLGQKDKLLEDMRLTVRRLINQAHDDYEPEMERQTGIYMEHSFINSEMLTSWENEHEEQARRDADVYDKRQDADHALENARRDFRNRIHSNIERRDYLSLPDTIARALELYSNARDARLDFDKALMDSEKKASKDLLNHVREHFAAESKRVILGLEKVSMEYWEAKSELLKQDLIGVVTNGSSLDKESQGVLEHTILHFQKIVFDPLPDNLLTEFRLPFNPNRLWKAPIALQHHAELTKRVTRWRVAAAPIHSDSFDKWASDLLTQLEDCVMELNPGLKQRFDTITRLKRHLSSVRMRRNRLERTKASIEDMLNWKFVES